MPGVPLVRGVDPIRRAGRGEKRRCRAGALFLFFSWMAGPPLAQAAPALDADERVRERDTSPPTEHADGSTAQEGTRQEVRVRQAELHYVEGMALFNRGQYREAAAEFERSYAAIPAARTLYSIGLSYERAGATIPALQTAERYLALPDCAHDGGDPLACAERRNEVAKTAERLRRFVGELRLELAPGVELREVRVAGRVVPLDEFPLRLMPGPTEVEFFGPEPEDYRVRIPRIAAGEPFTLRVAPFASASRSPSESTTKPVTGPTAGPDERRVDTHEDIRRQTLRKRVFWGGLGLTAASGAATGILGAFTIRENRLFAADLCMPRCPDENDPDHRSFPLAREERFHRLRIATNAMIGVTAAFGVATVVMGVLAFSRRDKSARRANVRLTGTGVSIRF